MTIPDYHATPEQFKAALEAGNARVRVRWLPDDGDGKTGASSRRHCGPTSS